MGPVHPLTDGVAADANQAMQILHDEYPVVYDAVVHRAQVQVLSKIAREQQELIEELQPSPEEDPTLEGETDE